MTPRGALAAALAAALFGPTAIGAVGPGSTPRAAAQAEAEPAPSRSSSETSARETSSVASSARETSSSETSSSETSATDDAAEPPRTARAGASEPPEPPADEEEDDDDPYDFLWIQAQGGISYVNMRAISADNYYPEVVRLDGTGPMGTLAVGFRISFLSVGLRGTLAHYGSGFDVGTATAEAQIALPIPVVRPYLRVGFGLGWHGDADYDVPADSQTTVFGWVFNSALGLDVFVVEWLSLGAAFSVDILNMSRQSFDEQPTDPGTVEFTESGDAVGLQVRGQAGVTIHL